MKICITIKEVSNFETVRKFTRRKRKSHYDVKEREQESSEIVDQTHGC